MPATSRSRLPVLAVTAAIPLLTAACCCGPFDSGSDDRRELAEARSRWVRAAVDDYAFTVTPMCFCPDIAPIRVQVRDGAVVSRVYAGTGETVPADRWTRLDTAEELFAIVDDALDRGAFELRAEYHDQVGIPTGVWIDYERDTADEEFGFTVTDFVARTGQ